MDRLRAYEVFVSVVTNGGFTRAAEALGTSSANVTRYIKELEAALSVRLLNRSSRRLSLTDDGRAFYERVRDILEQAAEAEAAVSASSAQPRGKLRINAPLSFGLWYLAPLWPQFMALYPDIELDINLRDRVIELVEDGYDLAIRISPSGSPTYIGRKLATAHSTLCASPDYLARNGTLEKPDDLTSHACIGYAFSSTGDAWTLIDTSGAARTLHVHYTTKCTSGHAMRDAALSGKGIVLLPLFMISQDLLAGRLLPLLPEYRVPDIDIIAAYPARKHLSAKVRVMIDFLVQELQNFQ
jgi:DNA-binding transcriptional LysR family regulator